MNMLFRHGEFNNLSFAFPNGNSHYNFPNLFSASYVEGYSEGGNKTFNIMCHHMHFKFTEVEKVMPSDTFYFTILRNPITQMESLFTYNKASEPFRNAKSLEDFLKNSSAFYHANARDSYVAKNLLTFDLGFDPNGLGTRKNLKLTWQTIDTIFDLVLITEYFDESLILLKEALCWSYEDILSFPLNKRSNTTKKALSLEAQDKVKSWNNLDWQIYVYFNNSFWKLVEKFGWERMQREVNKLRMKRDEMAKICLQGEVDPKQLQDKSLMPFQSGLARILGYNLKPGLPTTFELLCKRLVTPELQYGSLLHDNQEGKQTPS
ncbi:galactose-3-O-sulfotransferase 2-like [Hyperolius riggenbachi]|uniref:galactose-3-O-sulfotransferase 2-like n=1 Tax=Hyperolius riggenbachi TaxID=752182 RepID=UPI0035A3D418